MIQLAAGFARQLSLLGESRPDGELLAAFLANRDEESFACLLRRHGPLVWSACRRMLPDPADAEDAFQTSFLVLVRRARRLANREALGPWLYRVAVWTARNIRRRNARMLARKRPLADAPVPCVANRIELHTDLDEALAALPEKYRTPLVLCHLQGWSRREAAARIGCPEGTLSSLLARGLDRLRVKLSGFDPAKALAVAMPAVPLALAGATAKAAIAAPLALVGSAAVSHLVEGAIRMFWIKKATAASVALLAVFGFGMGVGVSVQQVPGAAAGDGPGAVAAAADGQALLAADERAIVEAEVLIRQLEKAAEEAKKNGKAATLAEALDDLAKEQAKLARLKSYREHQAETALRFLALKMNHDANEELARLKEQLAEAADRLDQLAARENAHRDLVALAEAKKDEDLRKRAIEALKASEAGSVKAAEARKLLAARIARLEAESKEFRTREQRELDDRIARLKAEQAALQADAEKLALLRQQQLRELALLEAKRAESVRPVAPAVVPPAAATLDIAISAKDAAWPYQLAEVGADGKSAGTIAFSNLDVLLRHLARAGKDASSPRSVRLTVQADTPFDAIKRIVESCSAAGLKPPTTLNLGKSKAATQASDDYARLVEALLKSPR